MNRKLFTEVHSHILMTHNIKPLIILV